MQDLQPNPTTTQKPAKSKLFRAMWVRWCALPTHYQVMALSLGFLLLAIGSTFNRMLNQEVSTPVPYQTEVEKRADFESVDAPMAFLNISGAEFDALPPTEQINLIRASLPELEGRLLRHSNDVHLSLLSREATRLEAAARDEAAGGAIDLQDATGVLQIEACLHDLQGYQCVLLRYAGEAIAMMKDAIASGDPYLYSQAMVRFQAALFAFNDIEVRVTDASSLLIAVDNYRIIYKTVVERSPGAQTPPAMAQGPGIKGKSPINTWAERQGFLKPEEEDTDAAAQ